MILRFALQLRKTLKKKHTLPSYKMRYMPFFPKPDPPHKDSDVYVHDVKITVGRLNVTVVECSRLPLTTAKTHNELYCTLSVGMCIISWQYDTPVLFEPGVACGGEKKILGVKYSFICY